LTTLNNTAITIMLLCIFAIAPFTNASSNINGVAVHHEFGQESFIAALFTAEITQDAAMILNSDQDKQMQIRVLAPRLSTRSFKRMWIEGMAINSNVEELKAQAENVAAFNNLLNVKLKKGDIFNILRSESKVSISFNGALLGEIDDVAFFDLMLRTWIGSVPLSSQFRAQLLAGDKSNTDLLTRFNAVNPSEQRIQETTEQLLAAQQQNQEVDTEESSGLVSQAQPSRAQTTVAQAEVEVAPPVIQVVAEPVVQPSSSAVENAPEQAEPQAVAPSVIAETESSSAAPETTVQAVANSSALSGANESDTEAEEVFASEEVLTAETLLAKQLYVTQLRRWVYQNVEYPRTSQRRGEEGSVRYAVTIGRDRMVKDTEVIEAPRFARLTKAALNAIEQSQPYPEFPDEIRDETFTFSFPIAFQMDD